MTALLSLPSDRLLDTFYSRYSRLGFFFALTLLSVISANAVESSPPHILYINADDLGVMDVGYNSRDTFQTPNIDRLAAEGMRFTNAYAPAANCAPSRACVHSGQWAPRHGVYTVGSSERGSSATRRLIPTPNTLFLPAQQFTMAKALKSSGYKTIHLGKYHIGKNPLEDGFDVNVGGDQNGSPTGGYYSPWKKSAMKSWTDQIEQHPTHRVDVFADQAVEFMRENVSGPMFIHFSPYLVHSPLTAVPEFVDGYADKGIDPRYGSMVQKLDQAIGRLLDALDALKIADQTLVIFSSDNGGIAAVHPQAPFRAGKGSYYDGGIREPMVARWPGKIRSGSVCSQVVNTIDLFPTFVDVSQTSLPSQVALDGASLLPLLTESGEWTPRTQYWHFPVYLQKYRGVEDQSRDPLYRTRPGSAMRDGKWKLHEYFEDGSVELYDLETDPGERNNLSSTRPEVRTQLYQKLVNWRKSVNAPVPSEKNPKFNPEKERKGIQEALEKARR